MGENGRFGGSYKGDTRLSQTKYTAVDGLARRSGPPKDLFIPVASLSLFTQYIREPTPVIT